MNKLTVEYDDDIFSIIESVNKLLKKEGLEFVPVDEEFDGYEEFILTKV